MKSCSLCWLHVESGKGQCGNEKFPFEFVWELLGKLEGVVPGIYYFMECSAEAAKMACTIGG